MSGFFKGIEEAKVGAGGIYFLANRGPGHTAEVPNWVPAKYRVKCLELLTMDSRKKDELFIVEFLILESNCPERPKGTKASWIVNMKQDAALGNIKGFLAAASGIDPSNEEEVDREVTESVCDMAVSKAQPFADNVLDLECVMIKTKADKDFTLHRWTPYVEATAA